MTASNKLSRIIAAFLCAFIAFGVVVFVSPRDEIQAKATATFSYRKNAQGENEEWGDGCNFNITFSGLQNNSKVTVKLEAAHEIAGYKVWSPNGVTASKSGEKVLLISFTYKNNKVQGQITGTNITKDGKPKVSISKIVTPTPKPTTTTKPTATKPTATTPKPTASTKQTNATTAKKKSSTKKKTVKKSSSDKNTSNKKTAVKKRFIKKVNTTTAVSETSEENKPVVPVVMGGDGTVPSNTDPTNGDPNPVEASLNHNNIAKNKKSFAWLWFVLALIVAGLTYLRVRSLKNQGKQGKDLVLDFIPGVGDLVYAIGGSTTKHDPIASDTQHGYMRNTAASKKEIKMMEEAEKKAEIAASRPVQMHKRPKELSVNHAAVMASDNAEATVSNAPAAAAAVTAVGMTARNESKPASPFKPVEGAAPVAKPASPFKSATQQNNNGTIMTSAFKPSAGAHNPSDKIVSSAFKPSSGAHNPSDKIVSSAFKQTQKFTPQKGPAQVTHTENDAVKLARERAAAAREQQAMREAMKTQKTAPAAPATAAKSEAKQHAPIKRPSAFSVNRAAVVATEKAEAENPAVNKIPAAPAVQRTSGASLGVGASAAEASKSGPAISPARAKASSNSNQLGNLLNGRSNSSGRAPVWAAPNTAGISPFKQSAEAQQEAKAEAAREEERRAAMEAEAPKTSYADQAKTHKSAFFSRSSAIRDNQSAGALNAYGGIVRPTGVVGEGERKQQIQNAAMGSVLEGQKPAILDPGSHAAPTAVQPVFGFKPIDSQALDDAQ